MNYDVIIIGGGPGGLTAGLYAARGGRKTAIVSGMFTGGQAALTELIENYSGHPSINGYELTEIMKKQAEHFGVEFITETADEMFLTEEIKRIKLSSGEEITAKNVILAMGAETKKLGDKREEELIGQGVSYCATCDGGFFRNRTVMVVGGGDTAVTDALYLSKLAKKVYLVHRRQEFRATKILVDRLKETEVELVLGSVITSLEGAPLASVKVKNILTNEEREIETNALFVAVGVSPRTDLIKGQVQLNQEGYIITDKHMRTNLPGVYAIGDCRDTVLRQVITAAADGAIAAESLID